MTVSTVNTSNMCFSCRTPWWTDNINNRNKQKQQVSNNPFHTRLVLRYNDLLHRNILQDKVLVQWSVRFDTMSLNNMNSDYGQKESTGFTKTKSFWNTHLQNDWLQNCYQMPMSVFNQVHLNSSSATWNSIWIAQQEMSIQVHAYACLFLATVQSTSVGHHRRKGCSNNIYAFVLYPIYQWFPNFSG